MENISKERLKQVRYRTFTSRGKTVTEWADEHGFNRENVYKVLNGHHQCRFGDGWKIAVTLGLINPDIDQEKAA